MDYYWIILIVAFASLVKGLTGFGFALVALPPLLYFDFYSPKEIIPVLMLCNMIVSLIIVLQKKERKLVSQPFRILIVYGTIFTIIGTVILNNINEHTLIRVMSIFFIILSILAMLGTKYSVKLHKNAYKIAGAILGLLTGSTSISGPPLALFLNSAKLDNRQIREIFAWFSVATAGIALTGYLILGLFTLQTLKITATFLPILFVGAFLGKRLNHCLPTSVFKKIILLITLLSSVILLLQ